MPTRKITVKLTSEASFSWVFLDDKKLSFSHGISEEIDIETGASHRLKWYVVGAPGTAYKIEIPGTSVEPVEMRIALDEEKATGTKYFEI